LNQQLGKTLENRTSRVNLGEKAYPSEASLFPQPFGIA
jgi:hypothetical protein